jgi:hypothetical protein
MRTVLATDPQGFGRVTIDEYSSTGMAGLYGTAPTPARVGRSSACRSAAQRAPR